MDWWDKVAAELGTMREQREVRLPNEVSPEAVRRFKGTTIETTHRAVGPRLGLPEPEQKPLPQTHFPSNGRLLDSKESFLSKGKKGRW